MLIEKQGVLDMIYFFSILLQKNVIPIELFHDICSLFIIYNTINHFASTQNKTIYENRNFFDHLYAC